MFHRCANHDSCPRTPLPAHFTPGAPLLDACGQAHAQDTQQTGPQSLAVHDAQPPTTQSFNLQQASPQSPGPNQQDSNTTLPQPHGDSDLAVGEEDLEQKLDLATGQAAGPDVNDKKVAYLLEGPEGGTPDISQNVLVGTPDVSWVLGSGWVDWGHGHGVKGGGLQRGVDGFQRTESVAGGVLSRLAEGVDRGLGLKGGDKRCVAVCFGHGWGSGFWKLRSILGIRDTPDRCTGKHLPRLGFPSLQA